MPKKKTDQLVTRSSGPEKVPRVPRATEGISEECTVLQGISGGQEHFLIKEVHAFTNRTLHIKPFKGQWNHSVQSERWSLKIRRRVPED